MGSSAGDMSACDVCYLDATYQSTALYTLQSAVLEGIEMQTITFPIHVSAEHNSIQFSLEVKAVFIHHEKNTSSRIIYTNGA